MKDIIWASETDESTLEQVGGKGRNLAEMMTVGLPVPTAFMVTAGAFQRFIEDAGLDEAIRDVVDGVDVDTNDELTAASDRIQELICSEPVPKALEASIREAYDDLSGDEPADVAIRSSATAEDLPEASFAGQQDTYLHIQGADAVVEHVRKCWASLYTPRAIYYREKNGFPHDEVRIAVIVQRMVEADTAGVLFTRHPTSGERELIIEAAWGLGEGVVSGSVSPDNYVVSPDGELLASTIATKQTMVLRREDGGVEEIEVPEDKRTERVLDDEQIQQLARLATTLEDHYDAAQDVEWAFEDGQLFVLQTRPITTIKEPDMPDATLSPSDAASERSTILEGLGAAPGIGAGRVVQLSSSKELDRVEEGDILVTTMTTPDMVPAMKRAASIVTDEGGMTCHAAIVSRELGIPCVVGTKNGTQVLAEDREVTVDGDAGKVFEGILDEATEPEDEAPSPAATATSAPPTATEVKVNVSMPEATERAAATGADGVGLLRVEHIVLGLGEHPMEMIEAGRGDAFVDYLVDGIRTVARAFHPDPVWVRTLDAPTDEFREMPGGDREPHEANPMLGFRGIRRGLKQPEILRHEFRAIKRLRDDGATNLGVMLPLVQDPREIREAKAIAREEGLNPDDDATFDFGIMIEVPASAILIDEMIEEGLDFVSFGTNDLTQYTLAVDRNNGNVADLFDEFHPAVGRLIEQVIKTCREHGVSTSICGQAGSDPRFAKQLVEWGITSISANIDAVDRVRETVARQEQRMLLDRARDG